MNIFVGNLSFDTASGDIKKLFESFGNVVSAVIVMRKEKKAPKSRGFGFVEMHDEQQAAAAIAALNGKEFMGRVLDVNPARPRIEVQSVTEMGSQGRPKVNLKAKQHPLEERKTRINSVFNKSEMHKGVRSTGPYMKRNGSTGTREEAKPWRRNQDNPTRWRKREDQPRPWLKSQDERKPWKKFEGVAKRSGKKSEGEVRPWSKREYPSRPWLKSPGEYKSRKKSGGESRPWKTTAVESKPWRKPVSGFKPWEKTEGELRPWKISDGGFKFGKKVYGESKFLKKTGGGVRPWKKPAGEAKPWSKSRERPQKSGFNSSTSLRTAPSERTHLTTLNVRPAPVEGRSESNGRSRTKGRENSGGYKRK